ncbi:MAG: hydrolase [Sphingomonadaceae bacterium]|nr:hydrolase [Sphingomonadaceae bacterium]
MDTIVTAAGLAGLLEATPEGVRVLSLDCFDTLLWRNCQSPIDVFVDCGGIWQRGRAERRARERRRFDDGRTEVSIEDIHRALRPGRDEAEIEAAVAAELEAEARHCYAFAPIVALMRAAKAKGLEVIVVSDTYLGEAQLRALITKAAGADVAGMIDRIFCSSVHGMTKVDGLFGPVLEVLKVPPQAIVHVGDNPNADRLAPAAFRIHGVHFRQFDPAAEQRLRLEAAAAVILDSAARNTRPIYQPHRAPISLRVEEDPAWAFGHDVMGPLMHGFASWIEQEAAALGDAKIVFLLRDGHLPQLVFEAMTGAATAAAEISRFTARRTSYADAASIAAHLAGQNRHDRVDVLAHQLGLTAEEGRRLGRDQAAFERAALRPENVRKIVERAHDFGDKIFAHLASLGIERGDTVMFVDLGYNGTVQDYLEAVLPERFGVKLAGRYLLLREEAQTGFDKKGFLDPRHLDFNALHALSGPIALIEQLCTIALGSVEDYGPAGEPIRNQGGTKGAQNAIRDRVQEGCVAFARNPGAGIHRPPASDDATARRTMAAATLARLLFMPSAAEVALFESFEHDVNLGTDDLFQLFDQEEAAVGLKRRGFFYLNAAERVFLPGELQPHGLALNLSLFSTNRFALDLRGTDFRGAGLKLPVILADNRGQTIIEVQAHPTHDGFHLATIPVGAGRFAAGIQLGALCEWAEVDEIAFYPVEGFSPDKPSDAAPPIAATALREGMTEEAPGLYRCTPGALLLVPPAPGLTGEPHLLAITFRPIVRRDPRQALREAA